MPVEELMKDVCNGAAVRSDFQRHFVNIIKEKSSTTGIKMTMSNNYTKPKGGY